MGDRPLLSILIPSWNRFEEVVKAYQSFAAELTNEVEVIIVDNASKSEIFSQLEAFFKGKDNVHLYQNDSNLGMVRNWNCCLEFAKGEWFSLLCSDDTFIQGRLTFLLNFLKNLETPSVVTQDPSIEPEFVLLPSGAEALSKLKLPIASGNIWHRKCFEELGGFDPRFEYSADAEYWYRLVTKFPLVLLKDFNATYTQSDSNYMWETWEKEDFLEQSRLLSSVVTEYHYPGISEEEKELKVKQELKKTLYSILSTAMSKKGKRFLFFKYFPISLKYHNPIYIFMVAMRSLLNSLISK
jgi:glycosyltransferase involved in cell wall biosynthesis